MIDDFSGGAVRGGPRVGTKRVGGSVEVRLVDDCACFVSGGATDRLLDGDAAGHGDDLDGSEVLRRSTYWRSIRSARGRADP